MANTKPKKDGVTVCTWVPRSTYAKLKRRADRNEHTVSYVLKKAADHYLETTK